MCLGIVHFIWQKRALLDQSATPCFLVEDMYAPAIDNSEALGREISHFLFCIRQGKRPLTDGRAGLGVVRILAAAQESIRKDGQRIPLPASSPMREGRDHRMLRSAGLATIRRKVLYNEPLEAIPAIQESDQ